MAIRKIVRIDENKCNGCGECVPGCAEGAIQIIDGKAKLIADNLCDGIGNCLGTCPLDAIEIIEREADEFDEEAVEKHLSNGEDHKHHNHHGHKHGHGDSPCGCPGTMAKELKKKQGSVAVKSESSDVSISIKPQLGQWPVQLKLIPETAGFYDDKELLITADCVPFAYPNYHLELLKGRSVAIGCPKLDDLEFYVEKLTRIIKNNKVTGVVVAHMEVPCCNGIVYAANEALKRSGKDVPLKDITVGIDGSLR